MLNTIGGTMFVRFFNIIILLYIGVFGSTYQADSLKGLITKGRGIALVNNKIILKDSVFIENSIPGILDSIYGKVSNSNKVKIAKLPDSVRVAERWDGQVKPEDGTNGQVLKTDGAGTWHFADEGSVTAGYIQSINGSNETIQTILGDNGIQVIDSGTGNPVHKIRPASGKIIPTGTGDTVHFSDSSFGAANLGGYPASYHDSVGHGTLQSQIFALSDSIVKKALKHHGVTVGRVPYANTDSTFNETNIYPLVKNHGVNIDSPTARWHVYNDSDFNTVKFESASQKVNQVILNTNHSSYGNGKANSLEFHTLGLFKAGLGVPTSGVHAGKLVVDVGSSFGSTPLWVWGSPTCTLAANLVAKQNLYSSSNPIPVQSQLNSKQDTSWRNTGFAGGVMFDYAGFSPSLSRARYLKYDDFVGNVEWLGDNFNIKPIVGNNGILSFWGHSGQYRKWGIHSDSGWIDISFTDSTDLDEWERCTTGVRIKKDTTTFRGKIITSANPTDIQTQLDSLKLYEYRTKSIKSRMLIKFNKPVAVTPNLRAFTLSISGTIIDTTGSNGSTGSYVVHQKIAIKHNNSAQPRADILEANGHIYTNVRLGNTSDGKFCVYLDTTYRAGYYGANSIDYDIVGLTLNVEGDSCLITSIIDSTYPATTSEVGPPASEQSVLFQTYTQSGINNTIPKIGSSNYAGIRQITSSGITPDSLLLKTPKWDDVGDLKFYYPTTPGSNSKPSLVQIDKFDGYSFSVGDSLGASGEMYHRFIPGDSSGHHIHYRTGSNDASVRYVKFEIRVQYCNVGDTSTHSVLHTIEDTIPANTKRYTHRIIYPSTLYPTPNVLTGADISIYVKRITASNTAPSGNPIVKYPGVHRRSNKLGTTNLMSD